MFWTDNPVADAERYYMDQYRQQTAWEMEHYRGKCPLCGKPMFEDSFYSESDCMEHDDYPDGWVHIICQEIREEDEQEEAAELERLVREAEEALAS